MAKLTEGDVELAERYAAALERIAALKADPNNFTPDEDEVKLAEDYLATLAQITEALRQSDWSQDDVTMANDYLGTLNEIDATLIDWSEDDVKKAEEYLATLNEIVERRAQAPSYGR
jgi:phosphoenolpyruvate carboxylase